VWTSASRIPRPARPVTRRTMTGQPFLHPPNLKNGPRAYCRRSSAPGDDPRGRGANKIFRPPGGQYDRRCWNAPLGVTARYYGASIRGLKVRRPHRGAGGRPYPAGTVVCSMTVVETIKALPLLLDRNPGACLSCVTCADASQWRPKPAADQGTAWPAWGSAGSSRTLTPAKPQAQPPLESFTSHGALWTMTADKGVDECPRQNMHDMRPQGRRS